MKLPFWIAKRIAFSKNSSFSAFIIKVAVLAIALSLGVMIVSNSIINGFKKEIEEKVFGFWGHIRISSFEDKYAYDNSSPVSVRQDFYPNLPQMDDEVASIQVFATKPAILMTGEQIEGIVLKGIGTDVDWSFFRQYLVEGTTFMPSDTSASNDMLISTYTAKRLGLKVDDKVLVYFVQQQSRYRKLRVAGIYNTGLVDYDAQFALIDIAHIRKLNNWKNDEVGGFSVWLKSIHHLEEANQRIYHQYIGSELNANTIRDILPNIFDWLALQQTNERIITILMIFVAVINIISALLILILERTNMIGILKALGANNWFIRKIFLSQAAYIILTGLFWGNVVALAICYLQQHFQWLKLPEESYYISIVPIEIDYFTLVLLNVGVFVVAIISLILPTIIVSNIRPIEAIRFE
ncbi:MAG: FtsX-like permease family protein [Chitinophagales bacterium]